MNCLILGGAGFIGSHLTDSLLSKGHSVRVFDLQNVSTKNLEQSLDSIEIVNGDFENITDVSPLLRDMDIIVHLVGTTLPESSNRNPIYDVETNVIGTLNLLDEAVKQGVNKIIFASSGGTVYGIPQTLPISERHPTNPICSYGITKLTIEKYLSLYNHLYDLDYCVLRFGNPYGPRQRIHSIQGAIAVFLGKTMNDETITIWGDGSVSRDYFYIDDLIRSIVMVIENESASRIYNIGSGISTSLNDIISTIREVTGITPKVRYNSYRKLDVQANCLDYTKAKDELGWEPQVSLTEGIARTWEYLKKNNF